MTWLRVADFRLYLDEPSASTSPYKRIWSSIRLHVDTA